MRTVYTLITALATAWPAAIGRGHGMPLDVGLDGNRLTVGHGLTMAVGYADLASDPHEDAGLDFGFNNTLASDYPGFNIESDMGVLQMEVLSRPDFSQMNRPKRWLWFWDAATQAVAELENDPTLSVAPLSGDPPATVRQSSLVAGPTLTVVNPVEIASDQHPLTYVLSDGSGAAFGMYGVFARLKAPGYEPSDPFLLAFRYGVAPEDFALAASEINVAAGLAGDFDVDGDVDGADLLVWQRQLGATGTYLPADGSLNGTVDAADLGVWKSQYGELVEISPENAVAAMVPEPRASAMALCGLGGMLSAWRSARRRPVRPFRGER